MAILIQSAEPKSVASIIPINTFGSSIILALIIPPLIVFTTSPQAIIAPEASNIPARIIAPQILIAFAQTAGPILFATSFAPIFIAR